MAKRKNWIIPIIIIGLIALFIFQPFKKEGVLPSGHNEIYDRVTGECIMTTNVEPAVARYSSYAISNVWLMIDGQDNDGNKEAYGYYSGASSGRRTCQCGGQCSTGQSNTLLIENYNTNGDDIFRYDDNGEISVIVCSSSGYKYKTFKLNHRAAVNAEDCSPCQDDGCTVGDTRCHRIGFADYSQACERVTPSCTRWTAGDACYVRCEPTTGLCNDGPQCDDECTQGSNSCYQDDKYTCCTRN
jgi:hypothetical protein